MSFGGASTTSDPAERPTRDVEVEAEDIELGTSDKTAGTDLRTKGKRSLIKPSGATATSGLNM